MATLDAGIVFAGHRIDGLLGRGGMGVVYRATDVALDRIVALKVITPALAHDTGFRERFKQESRIAASIPHPHVITIYRAGEEDDELFVTMQYVDGTDLGALIVGQGRLDERVAARIFGQVAAALDAAHERGLVHRDVKPGNVLLEGEPESSCAYLTDFGLTKRLSAASGMTATGVLVGTIDYIAPEQIEGRPLDARTDVYALACVLFHALAGRIPYPRDTDMAKLYAHSMTEPPLLRETAPDVSEALDAVVRRGMAKRPDERFQTAGDLGRALAATTGERSRHAVTQPSPAATVTTPAAPPTEPAPRPAPVPQPAAAGASTTAQPVGGGRAGAPGQADAHRSLWLAVLVVALLVAAGGAAALVSGGGSDGGGSGPPDAMSRGGATSTSFTPYTAAAFTAAYPRGWTIARDDERVGHVRRSAFVSRDRAAGITIDRTEGVSGAPDELLPQVERTLERRASGYRRIASRDVTISGRPAAELRFATDGKDAPPRGAAYLFVDNGALYVTTSTAQNEHDVQSVGRRVAETVRPRA